MKKEKTEGGLLYVVHMDGYKKISPGSKTEAQIYCSTPRSSNKYDAKISGHDNEKL